MTKAPSPLTLAVGANIQQKRKLRGLTQEKLAEMVGIGQQSLSRMEKGQLAPRFERLQALADILHCTVAELFRLPEGEGMPEQAATLMDILRPLSAESQDALVGIAAEMARVLKRMEEKVSARE